MRAAASSRGPSGRAPSLSPLWSIEGVTGERFERELRAARTPVLMKGAAASWPAVSSWTPEAFGERFGALPVTPSVNLPDTEVPYLYRDRDFRRSMTMAEFIRRMSSGERCYLDQMDVASCRGLAAEYDFAAFGPEAVKVIALWIGAHTSSGLHYDWVDNLFVQVYGAKRVILAAPEEAVHLYPFPDNHTKSRIAPRDPDLRAFPRFRNARLFAGTVEPGDVLYIPRGWWHFLSAPGASISLTCWYGPPLTPGQELEAVLRLRDPLVWARIARDFVWHGVLARPYQSRLYSLPPSGLMLYELVRQQVQQQVQQRVRRRLRGLRRRARRPA
jgi:lysine-specific demethylase 8